jgi:hypothetical protein
LRGRQRGGVRFRSSWVDGEEGAAAGRSGSHDEVVKDTCESVNDERVAAVRITTIDEDGRKSRWSDGIIDADVVAARLCIKDECVLVGEDENFLIINSDGTGE